MKVKNTKTMLLFLLGVAALSPLGLRYATADDGEDSHEPKTQAFDPEKDYARIPDDVLLDRDDAS